MLPIILGIIIETLTVLEALAIFRASVRPAWHEQPWFGIIWLFFSIPAIALCASWGIGIDEMGLGLIFLILLSTVIAFPHAMLLASVGARLLTHAFVTSDAGGISAARSCDRGVALALQGRADEAEAAFAAALADEPDGPDPLNAPIRISFGNFLCDRERFAEAARVWAAAVGGRLESDQRLVTALRAAEVFADRLGQKDDAAEVLRLALALSPKAAEASALRRRLELLAAPVK